MPQRAIFFLIRFCIPLVAALAACVAHAQMIDRVDVQRRGNEAEIAIRFTNPVQYLRHAPLDFGASLRIYAQIVRLPDPSTDLRQETKRLPETDMIPRFTLTYPEADGSLSITFDSPTRFSVQGGDDGKSIFVLVPVLPKAQDFSVQIKGTVPVSQAQAQAKPQVVAPVAVPRVPDVTSTPPASVAANRSIDSIDVRRLGKDAEIRIRFTSSIRLARPTPQGTGASVSIYPQIAQAGKAPDVQGRETNRLENTDLVPHFSVTYPEIDSSLLVRFDQSTRYSVELGPDDRSISIVVPAMPGAKDLSLHVQGLPPATIAASIAPAVAAIAPPPVAAAAGAPATPAPAGPPAVPAKTPTVAATTPSAAPQAIPAAAPPPVPAPAAAQPVAPTVVAAPQPTIVAPPTPAALAAAPAVAPLAAGPAPSPSPAAATAKSATASTPSLSAGLTSSLPLAAAPSTEPTSTPAPLSAEGIEAKAKSAMEEGQRSLASRNGVIAAERFGQVLALPPNSQSQLAQALIGEAREFSGELRKAKAEYELYLKRYPSGAEAAHVKERLAALDKNITQMVAATPASGSGLAKPADWTVYGSISQYAYRGNSQVQTITPPPPGQLTFSTDNLTQQDQNSIMTTLDLNARKRDASRDTRIVIRDTDTHNYLYGQPQDNRLYSAYFEQTDKQVGYMVRAGRQTGTGGGVFGRFDGVTAGYNLTPNWRVNGVVGTPVEFGFPLKRSMQGLSIDRVPELNKFGYSLYYNQQTLEGINDRKAVGGEARYFDPKRTAFALFDYDINFHSLNMAMAQANLRTDAGTNYFANIDVRKTPPLGLLTAIPAQPPVLEPFFLLPIPQDLRTQLLTAVNSVGIGDLRSQAAMLTGTSRFFTVGFMRPVTPKWQAGANYSLAYVTGTGDVGVMPAQRSAGGSNVYSGTVLGNNLMLSNDTVVFNGSLIDSPTNFGQSYNVSYIVPYNAWRFDTIIRYYTQKDTLDDQKQVRIAPTLKIVYRWRNSVSFEFEAGNEISDETGSLREVHSRRRYFFGGYRWDFH